MFYRVTAWTPGHRQFTLQRSSCMCMCSVGSRPCDKGGVPQKFLRPFGLQFGQKITKGPSPRAPPLDPSLMWTEIRSPSQCWRGGSVLWTIFIEIKKIYNLKLNHVLKGITFQFIFYSFKNT